MRFDLVTARTGLALAMAVVVAAGCSVSPDEDSPKVAYEDAESSKPLEVPPDLTTPNRRDAVEVPDEQVVASSDTQADVGTTGSNKAGTEKPLLPQTDGIRLVRGQDTAWIEVDDVPPERIWPKLEEFLKRQGLSIARKDPELGLIETSWFDRGDRPDQGGITGFISGLFANEGGQTRRHKYQIQLERGDGGTRIFVEHRRVAEVPDSVTPQDSGTTYSWQPQGGDPAVENELRKRLLLYMGVTERRARGIMNAAEAESLLGAEAELRVESGGRVSIRVIDTDLGRVFARVGRALDRIGARTESASRDKARYRIEWTPPPSSADGNDGRQPLQVKLRRRDEGIDIVAANADGDRRNGTVHRALLEELVDAMGGRARAAGDGETAPTAGSDEAEAQDAGSESTGQDQGQSSDEGYPYPEEVPRF